MSTATVSIRNLRKFSDHGWAWEEKGRYAESYTRYRTNNNGEGLFEDRTDGLACNDPQILGTGQFTLRGCDYHRAYRRLRSILLRENR